MKIKAFEEVILLEGVRDVLKVHLFIKMIQKGIKPMESDLDVITELYLLGGYKDAESQSKFISTCIERGYKKSDQSVRNTVSKWINAGVLEKPKNQITFVNHDFIYPVDFDKLALFHKVSHAK